MACGCVAWVMVTRKFCSTANAHRQVFLSTLNRNPKSYLFAVIGAEYVLNMLPKGTHDYAKFIKPSELARWAKLANLEPEEVVGMSYNPLTKTYALGRDTSINYLMRAIRHV